MDITDINQTQEGTPGLKASNTTRTLAPKAVAPADKEEYNAKLAQLELESRMLENQLKKLQLADLQDQVHDREARRTDKTEKARLNGQTIKQLAEGRKKAQTRCNHRKGGNGAYGVVAGQGDDNQYAVFKHKFANADIWVKCLRCGKWWTPPIEENFETKEGYIGALSEYQRAVDFPTRNIMSSAVAMQWGDGGKYCREIMQHSANI